MPPRLKAALNAIAILIATSFAVLYFDLSPAWYSAAVLAWLVRRQWLYRVHDAAPKPAMPAAPAPAADETAHNL